MNSRPNKIKYIPNNNKNRIASSTSPSYKYLTTNTNKDNKNQKFNNSLNKSHEKCHSNQQFNNISNFQTYINFSKKKNSSIQNYILSKKKANNSINNNHNHSLSINQTISIPSKYNINNTTIKQNPIPFKKTIQKPKKILNLNTDFSLSRNSTLNYIITEDNLKKQNKENLRHNFLSNYMNNKLNKSLIKNSSSKYSNFPTKIYNDSNDESLILNNPEIMINHTDNNFNTNNYNINKSNKELANIFNELESKLNIRLSENKTNNKTKTYNILQRTFEEIIQVFPENNQHLLKVLLKGYHDLITKHFTENRTLKDEIENYKNKLFENEKEILKMRKLLLEKDKIIEDLKKKSTYKSQEEVSNSTKVSSFDPSSHDKDSISLKKKRNSFHLERQHYIEELNKKNIKDLDALYFYDKVVMKTEEKNGPLRDNNGEIIPKLDLDFEKRQRKEQEKLKKVFGNKIQLNKSNSNNFIKKAALSLNLK
jgi:hypothetical protein